MALINRLQLHVPFVHNAPDITHNFIILLLSYPTLL